MRRVYTIDWDELPVQAVDRASILLGTQRSASQISAAVLDADRDEFVRVPQLPDDRALELFSLSPDGTQLLDEEGSLTRSEEAVITMQSLATAARVRFGVPGDLPIHAALSPDGRTIATLSADRGKPLVAVGMIDVAGRQYRRVWTAPGSCGIESAIGWSPDGTRLAATYTGDFMTTGVLDSLGQQIRVIEHAQLMRNIAGSWLDNDHLICAWDDESNDPWNIVSISIDGGTLATHGTCDQIPYGRVGDRLVRAEMRSYTPDGFLLETTDLRGNDWQPFIEMGRGFGFHHFDTWIPVEH